MLNDQSGKVDGEM